MDSQLFRLNQMSYQHHSQHLHLQQQQQQRAAASRQHYSNRQQGRVSPQQQQVKQQVGPVGGNGAGAASATNSSLASSGSDQDDQVHLSSLSTATNKTLGSANSQAAILGHNNPTTHMTAKQQQQHHLNSKRQQEAQMQREHQMAAMMGAGGKHRQHHHQVAAGAQHNRQAALQAHTLTAPGSHHKQHQQDRMMAKMSSSDQLTTSSDQTIDDLHQLAPHHHFSSSGGGGGGPRQALRYDASQSSGGGGSLAVDSQSGSRFLLGVLFTIAELLLFASVLLWLYWAYQHDDGLAWQSDRKQQFNTHAALMLFGFIFLSGQAMLIHRSFSCCSKIYTKILHTILFVLATSAISLGLILAYTAQENVGANNKPIMHFYSLHAWCGLTTVALFALQFVFGFVSFLILLCCDQATAGYRAALLPIHKTFGLIIFSLAVATCLTGLLQTARSRLSSKLNKTDYHELAEPGIVINLIGVCLICLAILMPYIIRNLDIKRATTFRSQLDRHLNKLSQLDMRI